MSPFNWLLYLDVADYLMLSMSEAHFRSAVSRAYYGVFGEIHGRLQTRGVQLQRKNIHQEVIRWLRNQSQMGIVQIGMELDRLRRERNRADYAAMKRFTEQCAKKSLLKARSIEINIPIYLP